MYINLNFRGYWRDIHSTGVPNEPGIYCIYVGSYVFLDDKVDVQRLIYIGESHDVQERIENYKTGEDRKNLMSFVSTGNELMYSYAKTNSVESENSVTKKNRKLYERQLIWENKPPANKRIPSSDPGAIVIHSGRNVLLV